WQQYNSVPRTF
nr:immunoglobulin light chain junction region [Macaca mulatta]